jgi:hypothetical protein
MNDLPSMMAGADLEHPVGKIYYRNRRKNDNTKTKVIKPPHYSPPFELYTYYTSSGIESQENSPRYPKGCQNLLIIKHNSSKNLPLMG